MAFGVTIEGSADNGSRMCWLMKFCMDQGSIVLFLRMVAESLQLFVTIHEALERQPYLVKEYRVFDFKANIVK